ncbi:MAG: FIST N-terminal domain-containing protein [Phycisphaerales bacterium]
MSDTPVSLLSMGAGLGAHEDAVTAAERACDAALESLREGPDPDLAMVFVSSHHADLMGAVGDVVHRRLSPATLLAVSAEAVIGGTTELEGKPGVSMLAARLPGVSVRTFTSEDLPAGEDDAERAAEKLAENFAVGDDLRAILLFADPFSAPMVRLLPALTSMCRNILGLNRAPIFGAMASAGSKPGVNGLIVNKRLSRTGAVGAIISGDISIDGVVSQGCKPFGPTMVVTGARHNVITMLSGKPALQMLHEAVEMLPPDERDQLSKGVFLGRVVNEYKERFGRGDYLIRNILGVDQGRGAFAVADLVRVGQTVRFHLRDAQTADEDLRLLLAAQKLKREPAGALLLTCNGRGTRLFDAPDHDAKALAEGIKHESGAEPPIAGFFAAGEIGPVGDEAHLHGQTAVAAVFRPRTIGALDE